mmetsp:Transcript_22352/g.46359  ORF Transcript_22352/g.46359 Transcript_22352/m.46359 type:complete len:101 (+) Transcript_22352:1093-1395(+)
MPKHNMNRPTESSSYTWLMSGILPIKTLQGFLPIFLPGKRKFISSLKQACDLRPQQRNTTSIIIHVTYRNNYFNSILLKKFLYLLYHDVPRKTTPPHTHT